MYFCFIDDAKAFDDVDHKKLWKEMGIPNHLTCLLRNLYSGQETTVRTQYGTMDWFKTGKGVRQGCLLSPCLFNLHAEYIVQLNNKKALVGQSVQNPPATQESVCSAEDPAIKPGRSAGGGNGNPLQYSCLENPMDRGDWRAIVHRVTKVRHDWATNTHTHSSVYPLPTMYEKD